MRAFLYKILGKGYLFLGIMAFSACTQDDLKKVDSISSKKVDLARDRSLNVQVEYSDSAIVKARGFAPVYEKVTPQMGSSYNEMPKGIKIEFFDDLMNVTGTITSDYALNNETEKITIFSKNVVVVNKSITFKTEKLVWDENKRMYTSDYGTVITQNGTIINGAEFSAPQDFSYYNIKAATGSGVLKEGIVP